MIDKHTLPEGWEVKKLKDITEITSSKRIFQQDYVDTGIPFYRTKEVKELSEGKELSIELFITKEKYEEIKSKFAIPKPGDILISAVGTIGVSYIVKDEKPFYFKDGNLLWIKSLDGIDSAYLNYFIAHNIRFKQTISVSGSAYNALTIIKLKEFEIPLPPLSEQQEIVAKIEELLSELDQGKQQLETARQQLKVYRQAVLKWAFEGKLTNAIQHRQKTQEGELPESWKWVNIVELAEKNKHALKAGPFGSALKKEFYVEKGFKIYGQEQVISGNPFFGDYYISQEKFEELKSNKIKPFDILISLVGTVGKVLVLPENCEEGIINPRLIKISLNRDIYLPKFFKYYFESSTVKSLYGSKAQGTTMDVLNLGIIKTIPFPLCSLEEQTQIVQDIESRLSVCDKVEETITQSLQQAETLRQSILKQAFEGKLVKAGKTVGELA